MHDASGIRGEARVGGELGAAEHRRTRGKLVVVADGEDEGPVARGHEAVGRQVRVAVARARRVVAAHHHVLCGV